MNAEGIRALLDREPFVPLRLFRKAGKPLDIPFRLALKPVLGGVIVFKGLDGPASHFAKDGYEHVGYQNIDRIEERPPRARRRKKAG